MSFDLTLWCRPNHLPDVAEIYEWIAGDRRFASLDEFRATGYGAVTTCGGGPFASVDVEDVSDLDDDDFGDGPVGYRPAGIRIEVSYSAPNPVTGEIIRLVGELADRFNCVVRDEQFPSDEPSNSEAMARGWLVASAHAREVFARHQQQQQRDS